ncbi:DUF2490 domain-containing protein [Gramella lutea]|uniref:DUF2490 domain-containing protein n=1 Tax=Christiangramia lutea TaxID=1607951 RepID=A0A9X1V1Y2_9FLAO|nr:DUF2490 domain-containing protein [Christiangramia lutea]MCH4822723.1 DUF2490 domain-containing protein [Christiangramia lutea]
MTTSSSRLFYLLAFLFVSTISQSQNFVIQAEPEIAINIDRPNRWSFNFGITNRDLLYFDKTSQFRVNFVELSHFTSYEVGFYGKLSLGLRYRFNELFEDRRKDEIRITQQYSRSRKYNALKVAHRFRFEQRIRELTIYRGRYQFSVEYPLNGERIDRNEYFLVMSAEALWSFTKEEKPELGQRFDISLGKDIGGGNKADLGLQYRLEEYNLNSFHGLFLIGGLTISI